jgi:hypothetical protein
MRARTAEAVNRQMRTGSESSRAASADPSQQSEEGAQNNRRELPVNRRLGRSQTVRRSRSGQGTGYDDHGY